MVCNLVHDQAPRVFAARSLVYLEKISRGDFQNRPRATESSKMVSNNLESAVTPDRETTFKNRSISDFFSKGAQVKRSFLVSCILILTLTLLTFGQIQSQKVTPTQKNWTCTTF